MKKIFLILFSAFALFSFNSEPVIPSFNAIATAMSAGNAEALAKYFDSNVEISILDREDIYDKSQAKTVVFDFFQKNKPKAFNQVHQGQSKGKDTQYCIGELPTQNGKFRIYIYMKVVNDEYVIQEMRIDKQ